MKKKFIFQGVHMIFNGAFSEDIDFKEGEERVSTFVFIGRNLDKDYLIKGFEACTAEDKLRFQVGDKVLANMGKTYEAGVIIKLWSEG